MVRDQDDNGVQRSLGRIESGVDSLKDDVAKLISQLEKHDEKIGALERKQHWYSGFAAAIGTIIGIGSGHWTRF